MQDFIKIESGTLYGCDRHGNISRKLSESVKQAQMSEDKQTLIVTKFSGVVAHIDHHGNQIRNICDGAEESFFDSEGFFIRRKDGGSELRDRYGNKIRNI